MHTGLDNKAYAAHCASFSDEKEFDAFVSYAKWSLSECDASPWLNEELLALNLFPEVLEKKYGYSLCLLDRDAAPGGGRPSCQEKVKNKKGSLRRASLSEGFF